MLNDNIIMEDKGVSTAARDNLVNECTNMGPLAKAAGSVKKVSSPPPDIKPPYPLICFPKLRGFCRHRFRGLISALLMTVVVPMAYDNVDDWLEEDYAGSGFAFQDSWIGQQLSESALQEAVTGFHDMSLICYFVGSVGYLCSRVIVGNHVYMSMNT